MSTTMTTAITALRERLDEASAQQWSDTALQRWLNEGCKDIARKTESLLTTANITGVAGTQSYTAPTDLIRINRIEWQATGEDMKYPLDYRFFNAADEIWYSSQSVTQGRPEIWTYWGTVPALTITLYPTPSAGGTIKVFYYKLPAEVSGGTALPIPEGWEDCVYAYAEAKALRADRDPRWQEAQAEYQEKINDMLVLTGQLTDQPGQIVHHNTAGGVPNWLSGGW